MARRDLCPPCHVTLVGPGEQEFGQRRVIGPIRKRAVKLGGELGNSEGLFTLGPGLAMAVAKSRFELFLRVDPLSVGFLRVLEVYFIDPTIMPESGIYPELMPLAIVIISGLIVMQTTPYCYRVDHKMKRLIGLLKPPVGF